MTPTSTLLLRFSSAMIIHASSIRSLLQRNFPRSSLEHFLNHDHVDFFGFEMLYKVQYLRQAYNLVVKNWFDIPCQACLANPTRYRNVASLSVQKHGIHGFLEAVYKAS
ncbi:hypothetical protein OIU78_020045 [Salix suchowensis]|nr:hypothetical protein OIU78_020045 [Salix suchowensis]